LLFYTFIPVSGCFIGTSRTPDPDPDPEAAYSPALLALALLSSLLSAGARTAIVSALCALLYSTLLCCRATRWIIRHRIRCLLNAAIKPEYQPLSFRLKDERGVGGIAHGGGGGLLPGCGWGGASAADTGGAVPQVRQAPPGAAQSLRLRLRRVRRHAPRSRRFLLPPLSCNCSALLLLCFLSM
jgi:hypothetical protein